MTMRLACALFCATLPLTVAGATQSATLSGSWALDAAAAKGEGFELSALSGTLTLEQKGDAVTGMWKGRMPEPWTLTGRASGATFELESETRNVGATVNGEATTVPRRWVFRGSANGDKITGSMSLAGGDGEPPAQPFTASRKK